MAKYSDLNLDLYVAAYGDDTSAAKEDYKALKRLDDVAVVASVVMSRDAQGKVSVDEHGGGQVGGGATVGGVAGLVVGLFAPPLLAATAVGAGIGAAAGKIAKRHEEKRIASSVAADDWLPPRSCAIVAVVDDRYLDRVDAAVGKASKKVQKAIDKGDYDDVVDALNEGGEKVAEVIGS
ncbi:MAG TPA: DUF1269 domain-containing protein [Solirubrobacteraceae bacterium]|nr:DUF1269 domain-containing protein [Solirubrobacteraceae bacterium]